MWLLYGVIILKAALSMECFGADINNEEGLNFKYKNAGPMFVMSSCVTDHVCSPTMLMKHAKKRQWKTCMSFHLFIFTYL